MRISPVFVTAIVIVSVILLANCTRTVIVAEDPLPTGATKIEATAQRSGDATAGYQYLIYGDYLSAGIPLPIFTSVYSKSPDDLARTGDNSGVPYSFNAFAASNGVKVVANNCFSCHAQKINGQLVLGLGNNASDNSIDRSALLKQIDLVVQLKYGANSPEWKAYYPFSRGFTAIAPYIKTATQGVNPADKIFAALSAHRKSDDLAWVDQGQFTIATEVIPTDVPPWWNVKKKNALYYNGLGVKDFSRLILASELVAMGDSAEARKVDTHAPDVLAWIKSIQPPKYPFTIDAMLAASGKTIFEATCSKCHGTYGASGTYPNLLLDASSVGTDAALVDAYTVNPEYNTWYNKSWFAQGVGAGNLVPTKGYVAPPLDGIWATAPYFHNGSVPTLDDVLNSGQRPKYWSRTFDDADYDKAKVGWNYTVQTTKVDVKTYDTSLKGYGNGGHTYGDVLSVGDKKALVEYLKTL